MTINQKFIISRMYDLEIKNKKELLEKLNMSSDTYNKKMKGDRDWKLNELWKLSQILDCEVQELLKLK